MVYTSIAPWFGGKRMLASKIIEVLGPHRCYWEPFCGSMAVLLSKPVATMETVNDLHADLVNLGRAIRDEATAQRLYWKLRRTLTSEDMLDESVAFLRAETICGDDPAINFDRAYHYFVASWLSMNGMAGVATKSAHNFARRFTSNGGSPGTRFVAAVESLPDWHERLRATIIMRTCGIAICERIEDKDGTVIYVDSPYIVKGAKYVHDFSSDDHTRLAAALQRYKKTRVVASYYEHPDLELLYPPEAWQKLDVATTKAMVNSGKREAGAVNAPEVLLVNKVSA